MERNTCHVHNSSGSQNPPNTEKQMQRIKLVHALNGQHYLGELRRSPTSDRLSPIVSAQQNAGKDGQNGDGDARTQLFGDITARLSEQATNKSMHRCNGHQLAAHRCRHWSLFAFTSLLMSFYQLLPFVLLPCQITVGCKSSQMHGLLPSLTEFVYACVTYQETSSNHSVARHPYVCQGCKDMKQ